MFSKWLQNNDEKFMGYIRDTKNAEKQLGILERQRNMQFMAAGGILLLEFLGILFFCIAGCLLIFLAGFSIFVGSQAGGSLLVIIPALLFGLMGFPTSMAVMSLVNGIDSVHRIKMIKIAMYLKENSTKQG